MDVVVVVVVVLSLSMSLDYYHHHYFARLLSVTPKRFAFARWPKTNLDSRLWAFWGAILDPAASSARPTASLGAPNRLRSLSDIFHVAPAATRNRNSSLKCGIARARATCTRTHDLLFRSCVGLSWLCFLRSDSIRFNPIRSHSIPFESLTKAHTKERTQFARVELLELPEILA